MICEAAKTHGLYPRPYKKCIMYAPPTNKTRALFTVWAAAETEGALLAYVGPGAFSEFYPVSLEQSTAIFGQDGWRKWSREDVKGFLGKLDRFFAIVREDGLEGGDIAG